MCNTEFDVIIIGGGPAGSTAGIYLSRAGLKTAIFERKNFPRETLCGEFLSREVIEILREIGLFKRFLELKPNKISSLQFITRHKAFKSDLRFEGFSLQRSDFDNLLLQEAASSGVNVIQPGEVREVSRDRNYFTVKYKSGSKFIHTTSAFVLGAFGRSNFLDRSLNRKFTQYRTGYKGIKFHIKKDLMTEIDDSSIYIFSGDNIYCGINTVNRGNVAVCFLDRKGTDNKTSSEHFEQLVNENDYMISLFNNKLPNIKRFRIYGTGNIYFGRKELIKNGIIMIGDAAKVIAPLAGDGIGMALESAKIASKIIIDGIKSKMNFSEIERLYKSNWNDRFRKRTAVASITQNIIIRNNIMCKIPDGAIQKLMPAIITATRN
jgi:flavin-dependent dehydrogenase